MKTISFNGNDVAYQIEGKGFPVVLIHGFCEDSKIWEDFKHDLIEERYRVVMVDLPGFGHSAPVPKPSVEYYAAAVLAVMDEKKLNKAVVIGHSMGGYTALALAELAPERISGLGLFHSHPYADSEDKKGARSKQIEFIHRQGHELYVKQLVPKLFSTTHGRSHPFDLDKLIHRAARYQAEGIIGGLKAMASRPDRSEVLKEINCPVLFIVGTEDEAVPAQASQDQLHLPAVSSIHILEKVAHMGMIEAKQKTQLIVRRFVDFCLSK